MCGLFGMIGPGISTRDLAFIKELGYISALRGTDGTGVLQGRAYKRAIQYRVAKSKHSMDYFMWFHQHHEDGDKDILDNTGDNFMIGHVRAATRGDLNDENAHPFDVGTIVGCHNGTLVDAKYKDEKLTDSEMMFKEIDERGIGPVLSDLDAKSAYAIVVFDKDSGEISFARNDARTLFYCWNKDRPVFYYASEARMLYFTADRQHINISPVKKFEERIIYRMHPMDVRKDNYPQWRARSVPSKTTRASHFEPVEGSKSLVVAPTQQVPLQSGPGFIVLPADRKPDNSNVVSLQTKGQILKGFKDVRNRQLMQECIYCQCQMDLYDQYKGTHIDVNSYSCEDCDAINKEIAERMAEKHKGKSL